MGLSTEDFAEISKPFHGVEIRKVFLGPDDLFGEYRLFVDGKEVWSDDGHEPKDICLSRDLVVFVDALRDVAAQREALRFPAGAVVMTPTEFNDMLDAHDEALGLLRDGLEEGAIATRLAVERAEKAEAALAKAEAKMKELQEKAVCDSFALEIAYEAARESDRTGWK